MNTGSLRLVRVSLAVAALLLVGACEKKYVAIAPLDVPPRPPVPSATFTASPAPVRPGEAVQLEWSTQYATYVSIYPVGEVALRGSRRVVPSGSTVYTLTALGPGGTYRSTLEVNVVAPPPEPVPLPAPPPAQAREPEVSIKELFEQNVKDVYFDYNRSDLRPAAAEVLRANADFLAAHPELRVIIAAHCDERGSEKYNMALATRRAEKVRGALEKLGIASDRVRTVIYGEEKPFCTGSGEPCLQENRRVHFSIDQ
jgi:peptidoglycan-associated lipoprotein